MLFGLMRFARIAIAAFSIVIGLSIAPSYSHPHLSSDSPVGVDRIGAIRLGMTVKEAESVAGKDLVPTYLDESYLGDNYRYFQFENFWQGVRFVEAYDSRSIYDSQNETKKIVRVEIKNDRIATISGIKIGDSVSDVRSTYPGQIKEVTGHYGGRGLIYQPREEVYKDYNIWFDIDDDRVTSFRIATAKWIYTIPGC